MEPASSSARMKTVSRNDALTQALHIRLQSFFASGPLLILAFLLLAPVRGLPEYGRDNSPFRVSSFPFVELSRYFSDSPFLLAIENLPAIFRCKDYVVFAVPFRMR